MKMRSFALLTLTMLALAMVVTVGCEKGMETDSGRVADDMTRCPTCGAELTEAGYCERCGIYVTEYHVHEGDGQDKDMKDAHGHEGGH
jgi:predicted amidophosphoribosyltransferase